MATITKGRELMTLINVFTVSPDKQEELAQLPVRATDETMRHLPGFISASIHRSLDGTKVINMRSGAARPISRHCRRIRTLGRTCRRLRRWRASNPSSAKWWTPSTSTRERFDHR